MENTISITIIDRSGHLTTYDAPIDMSLNLMEFCKVVEQPIKGECGGMAMCALQSFFEKKWQIISQQSRESEPTRPSAN